MFPIILWVELGTYSSLWPKMARNEAWSKGKKKKSKRSPYWSERSMWKISAWKTWFLENHELKGGHLSLGQCPKGLGMSSVFNLSHTHTLELVCTMILSLICLSKQIQMKACIFTFTMLYWKHTPLDCTHNLFTHKYTFAWTYTFIWSFPGGTTGKESACQCWTPQFSSRVRKLPWIRDRLPTPVFLGFSDGSDGKEIICNGGDLG